MLALTIYAAVVGTISLLLVGWKYLSILFKGIKVSTEIQTYWGDNQPYFYLVCHNRTKKALTIVNTGIIAKELDKSGPSKSKQSDVWYLNDVMSGRIASPGVADAPPEVRLPVVVNPGDTYHGKATLDKVLSLMYMYTGRTRIQVFIEDDGKNRYKSRSKKHDLDLVKRVYRKPPDDTPEE